MVIGENQRVIYGPPGTGKTSRLLSIVESELADGVDPRSIAYVSFTRTATNVARSRAEEKFGYTKDDLPYFRTLHSLCYSQLSLRSTDVLERKHLKELGKFLGYNLTGRRAEDGQMDFGALLMHMDSLARNRGVSADTVWHELNDPRLSIFEMRRFLDTLAHYKRDRSVLDYTDMLAEVARRRIALPVEVAVIDEAQDLTWLQWQVVLSMFGGASRVYIAGDDDQAIFQWAGADVDTFQKLGGAHEVLGHSHRLPRAIYSVAEAVVHRIHNRVEKSWAPRDDAGQVTRAAHFDTVPIEGTDDDWLVVARTGYMLDAVEAGLHARGVAFYSGRADKSSIDPDHARAITAWERLRKGRSVSGEDAAAAIDLIPEARRGGGDYTRVADWPEVSMADLVSYCAIRCWNVIWHDALSRIPERIREYYRAVLRRGGSLTRPPKIRTSTVHGAKGAEADNVAVLTDLSRRSYEALMGTEDSDAEMRVWYVAVTRARKTLWLVDPTSPLGFAI